jgi:16S rRNA processing protein RimM
MPKDDFYYIGRILKTYGNKGQVMVHLDVDDPSEYLGLESVYLDLHGERVPFFIDSIDLKHKNKAIFGFQDYSNIDDAECLKGMEMYLPLSSLPPLNEDQFYFHEIKGFHVSDATYGDLGIVEDVIELPHQSLLQVNHDGKEILIPIVDEIIVEVDKEMKVLHIEAPEGLIEIYLH